MSRIPVQRPAAEVFMGSRGRDSEPGTSTDTPLGATPVTGGTAFRTWAPNARDVHVVLGGNLMAMPAEDFGVSRRVPLTPLGDGTWGAFVPGVGDGQQYLFWVVGPQGGTNGFKRDPYARELGPHFPDCSCIVRDRDGYPWAVSNFEAPQFSDFVIYQLHVGVFWAVDERGGDRRSDYGKFLDVLEKLPYLRGLGVTAIQLLPVQEYESKFGLGYSGVDYFSPETSYLIVDVEDLARRLPSINQMFTSHGHPPVSLAALAPGPNQLKCLVDLCHVHGLAVIFDLVYNHAGGNFGDRGLYFFDRQEPGDDNRSLYFTEQGWAGGKVFAYGRERVRRFMIDNARFFLEEFRIDGIRYDEVSKIHDFGGDDFCRALTSELVPAHPQVLHIAEYWNWDRALAVTAPPSGLGFSAALDDRLRDTLRSAVAAAASGSGARIDFGAVGNALFTASGFPSAWASVQCLENHDIVRWDYETLQARAPRVAKLADYSDPESWYARSRSRVATGLLLTAPGIPMLFMGQEFLEDKPWHDDVGNWSRFLIWWDGLGGRDQARTDFLRFTTELLALRRRLPALRGSGLNVFFCHDADRVLAFQRWVEGSGQDVIVVATLAEQTRYRYQLPMPVGGEWREVFNSDAYDSLPPDGGYNMHAAGNPVRVSVDGPALSGLPLSATITLPGNALLVFARA